MPVHTDQFKQKEIQLLQNPSAKINPLYPVKDTTDRKLKEVRFIARMLWKDNYAKFESNSEQDKIIALNYTDFLYFSGMLHTLHDAIFSVLEDKAEGKWEENSWFKMFDGLYAALTKDGHTFDSLKICLQPVVQNSATSAHLANASSSARGANPGLKTTQFVEKKRQEYSVLSVKVAPIYTVMDPDNALLKKARKIAREVWYLKAHLYSIHYVDDKGVLGSIRWSFLGENLESMSSMLSEMILCILEDKQDCVWGASDAFIPFTGLYEALTAEGITFEALRDCLQAPVIAPNNTSSTLRLALASPGAPINKGNVNSRPEDFAIATATPNATSNQPPPISNNPSCLIL